MTTAYFWEYHQEAPTSGRKLRLLDKAELVFALPLIYRMVHPDVVGEKAGWFNLLMHSPTSYTELIANINILVQLRKKNQTVDVQLQQVNRMLNQYFSDLGWRMVRKELSQIKKRQKKSHIEVSKDIILRLKRYMELERLDSFDQALDTLLSEHAATVSAANEEETF
ncbi:MAG: hypothetical protein LRY75_02795 [Shewanella xiamenensis]|nr:MULTISPECIES: hypothetical protein [Shewanella]KPN77640.1 hypothetical protein AEA42_07390 [Shewanella sp. Sh95]MCD8551901.1 hypothetical protein [Shewanella xiamenensis]MCD8557755.1 hypothetical protein [Shewanella xiamenensis]MCH7424920.1 hypothetical protein [Shewanella sp. MM_2022_3]MCT8858258.1 hypothetical protein [Shewanella xiamenensis]